MRFFLTLVLLLWGTGLRAQTAPEPAVYTDAAGRCQLTYAGPWQLLRRPAAGATATFRAGDTAAVTTLRIVPLPDDRRDFRLLGEGRPDSVLRRIQRLPLVQILRLDQRAGASFDEVAYDYSYGGTAPGTRTHVLGRQLWRGGYEFRVEYRARASNDTSYLAAGQTLLASFAFTSTPWASRRYDDQLCDGKMYGIAALRTVDGHWEDDCRSIHEFVADDPTAAPKVHRRVLPFQSYALAKGFDNCLYSVTKAPTDAPERVYRYDPATRKGAYTDWVLPRQGPENVWISASTDDRGDLYFMASDANLLVRISPHDGKVSTVWTADPLRKAPFYLYIAFASAGTHGNFCLDDSNTMYLVYSTDGSLLKIDLPSQKPFAEQMFLSGLPARGGYSDLLMQNDAAGRRRMYLAGPHGLYTVDLARHQATRLRKGTYTDLAGCNLFRVATPPRPAPPVPATAIWEGRVLDATTFRPLPAASLRLDRPETSVGVLLSAKGEFAYTSPTPGRPYRYHVEHPGYFPADSTWPAAPGPLMRDVLLRPLAVGETLPLAQVQFEQSKAVLLPTSYPALSRLVRLLVDNPGLRIELRGHTDNVGPPEKNVILSEQRVSAVMAYLVNHGVEAPRITGLGLGGAEPIAGNEQEATRRLNRRVEFRITHFAPPKIELEMPEPLEP
jgi:outer membrane protein OmpA-like peptidoglycan-associated protein